MARPIKEGLDYFPFDVDFHNDEKIEVINGEFGVKGEVIAIRLLCAIYRDGYFIKWSEALKYKLAKQTNLSPNLISEVVTRLVRWGFFDKDLFNSSDILTSRGIQKRYQQITKRRKIETNTYWILAENEFLQHNVAKTRVNVTETRVNPELTKQRKVKETKVKGKKTKGKESNVFNVADFIPPPKVSAPSKKQPARTVEFPDVLQTNDFAKAWSDWEQYRKDLRKKLTPLTIKQQLKKLEGLGEQQAIAAIYQSIRNGWTGIFEPKTTAQSASWLEELKNIDLTGEL